MAFEGERWGALKPIFRSRTSGDPNMEFAAQVRNGTGKFARSVAADHGPWLRLPPTHAPVRGKPGSAAISRYPANGRRSSLAPRFAGGLRRQHKGHAPGVGSLTSRLDQYDQWQFLCSQISAPARNAAPSTSTSKVSAAICRLLCNQGVTSSVPDAPGTDNGFVCMVQFS